MTEKKLEDWITSILACPVSHSPLAKAVYAGKPVLVCTDPAIHRCYPIRDGIPELLQECGIDLTEDQHRTLLDQL